jgi:fatty-acyl-CoA synthase
VDLQKQGYDSAQTGDPLFVRNDKLQTYVPLTAATLEEALRG